MKMKDKKYRFEAYSFFDYTAIALHLSKMAEKGWMVEKVTNWGWTYRRITPKKITFSVSYFPKASEFDPEPTDAQKTFQDFCKHTGWMLAAASAQMQIFYNEQENPTPIETDPVIEVGTIHRAARKSFLPGYFAFLLISILGLALFFTNLSADPIGVLSSTSSLFSGFAYFMLFLLSALELCGYFLWHSKAKIAARRGEFIKTSKYGRQQRIILAIVLLGFAYWIITVVLLGSALQRTAGVAMLLYMIALFVLVNAIKQSLKRKKVPKDFNRIVTFCASFLLSFAMMGGITFGLLRAVQNGLFEENREQTGSESLLLGQFTVRQRSGADTEYSVEMPDLEYTVTEVKVPFLYEFCKKSLLKERQDETEDGQIVFYDHYEPTDPIPWQAMDAYRLYWSSGYVNRYLLCYENRIVEIMFFSEPTPEQMAVVADKFSGK